MKAIEHEFRPKGLIRGGLLLLRPKDALDMVRRSREMRIAVLGIDGFRVTEQTTQPVMEQSIDLSEPDAHLDCWARAESFLRPRMEADLLFEVVLSP